jgi:pimeloyl-ACP methyl ester carboxylesterase
MSGIAAVEGTGSQRVLVLHGWALDSSIWSATRPLTDTSRFTYAYFDFPGYGASRGQRPAEGLDGMARAAVAAVDELGWDRFAVLGHSMGGGTAMRVATMAPRAVSAVFALTPVSPGGTPLDAETYETFRSAYPDSGPILHNLAPHLTEEQLQEILARSRETLDRTVWDRYLQNWTSASFEDELDRYDAPTTLAVGGSDPFVTADYLAATVKRLRSGTLITIDGAGHYPMVEQPEATVRAWQEALS